MNWKYFIPHIWEEGLTTWEDIFLLPDSPEYKDDAVWLTIDALGDVDDPESMGIPLEAIAYRLDKLGDRDYWIEGGDMIARTEAFDKPEFLQWVRVWMEATGLQVDELIEAPIEDFLGRCAQADFIRMLLQRSGGESSD